MDYTTTQSTLGEPPSALVSALKRLLKPLVRLLISFGITYPFLAELLKSIYVDVAEQEFPMQGKPQTDSRISLLTGVHRKDTKRLRNQDPDQSQIPTSVSVGAELVAKWLGNEEYQDKEGVPRPLPRLASSRAGISFEELVQNVSKKDLRARVVLDELIRLSIVHVNDKDEVELNVDAFVPTQGFEEKAYYFGQNLRDHIAAGCHNLLGNQPPFFDRSVYYCDLTIESVTTLITLSNQLAMNVLKEINQQASKLQSADSHSTEANQRINLGIYLFNTPQNDRHEEEENG
ncbi:MAG: DUF6502 family protein [Methylococcales bacterium]